MSGIHIDVNGKMSVYHDIYQGTIVNIPNDETGGTKKYRVTRANPVNLKLEDEDGKGWSINRRGVKYSEDQTFTPAPKNLPTVFLGTIVRFTGKDATRFPGEYFVAAKHANDRCRFVKVGGDGDRYVTGSLESIEVVK